MAEQWTKLPDGKVRAPNGRKYEQRKIQDQIDDGRITLKNFSKTEIKPQLIYKAKEQINNKRDSIVFSDYETGGNVFQTGVESVRNMKEKLLEIVILDPSASVVWIAKDDKPVSMTHGQFKAMLLAIGRRKDAAYLRANVLKTALKSKSVSALENYSVDSEW
jgi:hypothetical protein